MSSKSKWRKYQSEIKSQLTATCFESDPFSHANAVSDIIYKTALNTIGYRKYIKTYKPWRNSKINSLQKSVKRLRRKLEKLRIKHPDFYQTIPKYIRLKSEYKSMLNHKTQSIRSAKRKYLDKINQTSKPPPLQTSYPGDL